MRKILIVGHARHGKDTVAEFIASELGVRYKASSEVCAEFIKDAMGGYSTVQECFEDRANHRPRWHELIKYYCKEDKARLGRLIFDTCPIYCGIRDTAELDAVIAEFDPIVIWVAAEMRKPLESVQSMNIQYRQGWHRVHNNSTLEALAKRLKGLIKELFAAPWDYRFMKQAETVATWSKDPDCTVGCVIVSPDKNEFATGYNGFPKGIEDSTIRLANKDLKLALTVHAELNAILNARRNLSGWTLYCTKPLCTQCALAVIQAGIVEVVCPLPLATSSWYLDQLQAIELLNEAKIVSSHLRDKLKI